MIKTLECSKGAVARDVTGDNIYLAEDVIWQISIADAGDCKDIRA